MMAPEGDGLATEEEIVEMTSDMISIHIAAVALEVTRTAFDRIDWTRIYDAIGRTDTIDPALIPCLRAAQAFLSVYTDFASRDRDA